MSLWSVGTTDEGHEAVNRPMSTVKSFPEDLDLNSPGQGLQALEFQFANFLICILENTIREPREVLKF